ncbi:hypothetical protein JOC34_000374 [Virgibacillus halotolerans]|uniref:hypothetical protein n=1 Tax=Virgibacillus halotolerans TaxID=1071053 RepID=UPI00195F437D|nr:hypothetical protein [Virgibacillus halotolerans]MBM7598017.1 hypothetical protein [Virgibacillus halotolerans]
MNDLYYVYKLILLDDYTDAIIRGIVGGLSGSIQAQIKRHYKRTTSVCERDYARFISGITPDYMAVCGTITDRLCRGVVDRQCRLSSPNGHPSSLIHTPSPTDTTNTHRRRIIASSPYVTNNVTGGRRQTGRRRDERG